MNKILILFEYLSNELYGILSWFLGGFDEKIKTLITMMIVEFIVHFINAIINNETILSLLKLNLFIKNLYILITLGVANLVDSQLFGDCDMLRSTVLVFYITYNGIIILDIISKFTPIPKKLKEILKILLGKHTENKE